MFLSYNMLCEGFSLFAVYIQFCNEVHISSEVLSFLHRWEYCWKWFRYRCQNRIEKYYHHDGEQLGFCKYIHIKTPARRAKNNISLSEIITIIIICHRKKLTTIIIREMHEFSHQFSTVRVNATNPWYGEGLGNWYSYFCHSMSAYFPLDFHHTVYFITWDMHGFLHQFPRLRKKINKTHGMGRVWEIETHTFPIAWVLFSH